MSQHSATSAFAVEVSGARLSYAGRLLFDDLSVTLEAGAPLALLLGNKTADGSALYAGGSFRAPGEEVHNFAPTEVNFTPLRTWQSPASQARYPVEWRIETPAGQFVVAALLDDQDHVIRLCIAKRPDLSPAQIERCVGDRDPNVRYFVARHPALRADQRERLLADEDALVRRAAAKGPRPPQTRRRDGQATLVR